MSRIFLTLMSLLTLASCSNNIPANTNVHEIEGKFRFYVTHVLESKRFCMAPVTRMTSDGLNETICTRYAPQEENTKFYTVIIKIQVDENAESQYIDFTEFILADKAGNKFPILYIEGNPHDTKNLQPLQQTLQQTLNGKRFYNKRLVFNLSHNFKPIVLGYGDNIYNIN